VISTQSIMTIVTPAEARKRTLVRVGAYVSFGIMTSAAQW
jgi:hypothetical protein